MPDVQGSVSSLKEMIDLRLSSVVECLDSTKYKVLMYRRYLDIALRGWPQFSVALHFSEPLIFYLQRTVSDVRFPVRTGIMLGDPDSHSKINEWLDQFVDTYFEWRRAILKHLESYYGCTWVDFFDAKSKRNWNASGEIRDILPCICKGKWRKTTTGMVWVC